MNYANDIIDEALKMILLEDEISNETANQRNGLTDILSQDYTSKMTMEQKNRMLKKLKNRDITFGALLKEALNTNKLSIDAISVQTYLPVSLAKDLIEDKVLANEIPVMLMKKLLNQLNISLEKAARAISKTFDKLNSNSISSSENYAQPSFRKSGNTSLGNLGSSQNHNDLFKNKEALNNYINHLKEIM